MPMPPDALVTWTPLPTGLCGRVTSIAGVATRRTVIEAWRHDDRFADTWTDALVAAGLPAFRWETPACTAAQLDDPFECVLLPCPQLARKADRAAFAAHFDDTAAVSFINLRGDATLVTPCPAGPGVDHAHLGGYLRTAPRSNVRAFWRCVGDTVHRTLDVRPRWLSTAGMGVAWLHVRLDDRPKYYGHSPYRKA